MKTITDMSGWEGHIDRDLIVKRLREIATKLEDGTYIVKETMESTAADVTEFAIREFGIIYHAKTGT